MQKQNSRVLEPSLCAPRGQDSESVVGIYSDCENSKMVRGEMLYKTSDRRNPANPEIRKL
jgi:hypothetical protein